MNDIIKQLCNTNELVELYTNRDDYEKFGVGYIIACTDNEYLVHTFERERPRQRLLCDAQRQHVHHPATHHISEEHAPVHQAQA